MCKTDSAKQHFCGSITHVVQYILLCLLLADSFKTLKPILLNTAEDIPALQAFLLSKLNVAGMVYFSVEPSSEELHTHTHTRFFSYINSK